MPKPTKSEAPAGVLWVKEKEDGTKYFSIVMGNKEDPDRKSYVAWKVKEKRQDSSPDFVIYESKPMEKKSSKSKRNVDEEDEDDDF